MGDSKLNSHSIDNNSCLFILVLLADLELLQELELIYVNCIIR